MGTHLNIQVFEANAVAITDVWQIVPETCNMEEYELFYHLRTNGRIWGVLLFCHKDIYARPVRVLKFLSVSNVGCGLGQYLTLCCTISLTPPTEIY